MKKLSLIYLSLFILIFYGCEEPVFIFDPSKPSLPIYTEKGYNVAGAEVNEEYWNSSLGGGSLFKRPDTVQIIRDVGKGKLVLIVPGTITKQNDEINERKFLTLIINTDQIQSFADLPNLNNTSFQLDNSSAYGLVSDPFYYGSRYANLEVQSSSGKLNFLNARYERETSSVIISGTFGFDYVDYNGNDNSVYYGRFDFKIYESMFKTL
ncbi:hypothetical protein [Mangrovivirga cuniculi]|uniref:Uncharacterized protein n=1 Tax=Mangrovivirga cuniculi TaxID=2715131 RepID=A0A4D7JT04_9BACT|nr:hypothetical protein [Mangrovivirga cuniculi]QCK16630.1 hypothetical protein DCC35_18785 [Mangrovivirga cuniculi]